MTLATKIAVLKDGVLQQFGTPAEIYNRPANMFVADFMGSPAMNLIPADDRAQRQRAGVKLERGERDADAAAARRRASAALAAYAGQARSSSASGRKR